MLIEEPPYEDALGLDPFNGRIISPSIEFIPGSSTAELGNPTK